MAKILLTGGGTAGHVTANLALLGELREKHIDRLTKGECKPQSGIAFLDIISNLERISDHATNIAGYVKNEI